MKTKHSHQRIVRRRVFLLFLALLLAVVVELGVAEVLATRCGQAVAMQADDVPAPNLSLGEVLAAIR